MPEIDSVPPGNFGWLELGTTDQSAAKGFYTALFGWGYSDVPMGPDAVYTMFNLRGKTTAAGYQIGPEMTGRGIPPHWLLYVAVTDADATAAKVAGAGGTVVMPPFDVMEQVRIAVLQDPTGATFAISQPKLNTGLGIVDEPGSLVWADLFSTDAEKAAKFYCDVLGWTTHVEGSPYIHFKNGEAFIGGSMPGTLPPGVPSNWVPYIGVENVDASAEKAASLGAKALMPPTSMEGVGRFATLADPQGAVFAIYQSEAK